MKVKLDFVHRSRCCWGIRGRSYICIYIHTHLHIYACIFWLQEFIEYFMV